LEEARVLAGFSHPAIVGVHLLLEAHGTVYMVMDYVEGESYEGRLKRIGREPDQNALMSVMSPILDGLEEVHAKGLMHRDIKPENILINGRGQPVLIDFGSARESVGKTMTMTSIVTHGYSPIEQYQTKGRMGPWTDIYAMGAVMCRAMTGEKPPVAADRLMDDDFIWLSYQKLSGFSDGFKQAIDWSLRVKPEERPQSVRQWGPSLGSQSVAQPRVATSTPQQAPQPSPPPPRFPVASAHSFNPPVAPAGALPPPAGLSSQNNKSLYSVIIVAALIVAVAILAVAVGVVAPLMKGAASNQQASAGYNPSDFELVEPPAAERQQEQKADNEDRLAAEQEAERLRRQQQNSAAEEERARQREQARLAEEERARQEQARLEEAERAKQQEDERRAQQSVASPSVLGFSDAFSRAEAGDAYAQAVLSIYYDLGYKTAADPQKAVEYAMKSAEQGNALGMYRLGVMRAEGKYIPKDEAQGARLKAEAFPGLDSMLNDPYALTALGVMVHRGEGGVASDWTQAAKLYKRAADQGYAPAQLNLSACYLSGKGVPQNEALGMKYWQDAYNQDYPLALKGPPR
jgi:serine/threonine protein kinase